MRNFKVPYGKILPDKIIYGRFTPKEAVFLGSIVLVFFLLFLANVSYLKDGINLISILVKIIVLLIYSIISLVLAFKKKDIYDMDEYLILKFKYKYRKLKNTIYEKYWD